MIVMYHYRSDMGTKNTSFIIILIVACTLLQGKQTIKASIFNRQQFIYN